MEGLEPRFKLWLEKNGKLAFSEYRAELLRSIRQTGSLAEAATRMGLSYRRAWGKIRELELNLGEPLVESRRGGKAGGRSSLTALGESLLADFDALVETAASATGASPATSTDDRSAD